MTIICSLAFKMNWSLQRGRITITLSIYLSSTISHRSWLVSLFLTRLFLNFKGFTSILKYHTACMVVGSLLFWLSSETVWSWPRVLCWVCMLFPWIWRFHHVSGLHPLASWLAAINDPLVWEVARKESKRSWWADENK